MIFYDTGVMMVDDLQIIDAGKGWIVAHKPALLSVHNEPGRDLLSLLSRKMEDDRALCEAVGYEKSSRISPVHRLDRETSGVMILSFERGVAAWFSRQFEERRVKKTYLVLVHGVFDMTIGDECFWEFPLSPEAGGRNRPEGSGRKAPCKTRVTLLDSSPHYSLLACEPITGRQHQIRRHAKLSGHPVLGDERYCPTRALNYIKTRTSFNRLGLHSHRVSITLPGEQAATPFSSPCPHLFLEMVKQDKACGAPR